MVWRAWHGKLRVFVRVSASRTSFGSREGGVVSPFILAFEFEEGFEAGEASGYDAKVGILGWRVWYCTPQSLSKERDLHCLNREISRDPLEVSYGDLGIKVTHALE